MLQGSPLRAGVLLFGASVVVAAGSAFAQGDVGSSPAQLGWIIGTIVMMVLIVVGFLWYMYDLQRRFFKGCTDDKQLALFFQSPAGLPAGTIRTIIALMLVTASLYFLALSAFKVGQFPEALTTLLGTVIGFYFGSRASSGQGDEALRTQVKDLAVARDEATAAKETNEVDALAKKLHKGIAMSRVAAKVLPEDMRNKYLETIGKLEQGLTLVEGLKGGNVSEAVAKAKELLGAFQSDNPVKELVQKARESWGRVLGGSVPQVALLAAIVGVGMKLVGVAYDKWKARILHAPFSPAVIPLKLVDANTGFVLLAQSPTFKRAFGPELERNDRPFMETAVKDFLGVDDTEGLWQRYQRTPDGTRFESREEFERGLAEFRRVAAGRELAAEIDPTLIASVGGYEALARAVDRLHTDSEATAHLDAVVLMVERLQQNNEPVQTIFRKALEEAA